MTLNETGPGGLPTAPALEDCWQGESYPPSHRPQGIDDVAEVFAGRVIEAERTLLSAGLWDPLGLHEHAVTGGLKGWHFTLPEHSFVFAYLCLCVELDHEPSDVEALELAKVAGVALDADVFLDADLRDGNDLDYIWRHDYDPRLWTVYVETVIENARDFARSQECLREAVNILIGTIGYDFDIIIRPRVQTRRRVVE